MKNKRIAVLVLALAGTAETAQAMSGMRKCAQQAFSCSKQYVSHAARGIAAEAEAFRKKSTFSPEWLTLYAMLAGIEISAVDYYLELRKKSYVPEENFPPVTAVLTPAVEAEVKALFQRHGFSPEMVDYGNVTAVTGNENKCGLALSNLDRCTLEHGKLDVCRGTGSLALEKKHVIAMLGHEIDHLIHNSEFVDSGLSFAYQCLLSVYIETGRQKNELRDLAQLLQQKEERCDGSAAYNIAGKNADPEVLAQQVDDLCYYFKCMQPIDERVRKHLGIEDELLSHPPIAKRIQYLEELAKKFRRQKPGVGAVGAFIRQQREELKKIFHTNLKNR